MYGTEMDNTWEVNEGKTKNKQHILKLIWSSLDNKKWDMLPTSF